MVGEALAAALPACVSWEARANSLYRLGVPVLWPPCKPAHHGRGVAATCMALGRGRPRLAYLSPPQRDESRSLDKSGTYNALSIHWANRKNGIVGHPTRG